MRSAFRLPGVVLGAVLMLSALARAQTAQEIFADAQAALAKGDMVAAIENYAAAVKAEPTNKDYVRRYTVVKRAADFEKQLAGEQDPKRWELLARALRSFYIREKLYPQALAVSEQIHQKQASGASALMLAETQLAMDKNQDAVKTLQALDASQSDAATQSLLAIAFHESGNPDAARAAMAKVQLGDKPSPGTLYIAARAYGKLGNNVEAMQTLQRLFESVPPAELPRFKAQAKSLPEFASVAGTPEFARVMATESKVKESDCSGGSDCASCPLGAKCPTAAGKAKEPAK